MKELELTKSRIKTGGGSCAADRLNDIEKEALKLFKPVCIKGHTNVEKSAAKLAKMMYVMLWRNDTKHWWKVQNSRGQAGYVPSNYVKKEKPSLFDSIKKKVGHPLMVKKGSGSKTLPTNNSPSRTVESPNMARRLPADPSEAIGVAIVKYNYQAQQPDELSLVKGSRILILEKSNDGWWRGQSSNISGWFPSNYTQEEGEIDDTVHTYAMAENVLDIVVALYSFSSSNEQELSFEKGDRLEILDRPASDPEWYKARNSQGQLGLVPRNYLQELSDYMDRPFQERTKPASMESSMERSQVSMVDKPHLIDKPCMDMTEIFLIRDSETNGKLSYHCKKRVAHMKKKKAKCDAYVPARKGSFFDKLKMSTRTVVDWSNFCREVCIEWCFTHSNDKIGGPGKIVEIDEAKVGRRKYHKGRVLEGQWIFGGIERGSSKLFIVPVETRDASTLMGDYSVSLKAPGRNKHFRVHVEGALYCIGQRKFHTLDQLVDHYQRAPIYTNKQGEKLYLVRPLPKTK
ncbi:hypothetical protein NQ317_006289 [Molorchus minor]|uniref:Cytoplasmic protein NCK1 n=1 Tax=Molorchus minor TaxID=1323400 RepID=A0ABQ9JE67_9CUCU|nr:hypothetical protein NQ317_006289 [Molorchus minor]